MSCPPLSPSLMPDAFEHCFSSDTDDTSYGDFSPDEAELLNELLATTEHAAATPPPPPPPPSLPPPVSDHVVRDIEDCYENEPEQQSPSRGRVPRVLGREKPPWEVARTRPSNRAAGQDRKWKDGSVAPLEHADSSEGRDRDRERQAAREREWTAMVDPITTVAPDPRSPLERFRRPPNKAFSVTDLVSPSWCELQYWYTLTKLGRKRRTPAMKQGTTIHKTLEDELYTTVSVEISTREDALALRIWNLIQGLRTLRECGMTRELEVWGLVDGELVNGVIDQLSYECPDPDLEATAASYYADVEASRAVMPEYQMSLSDYLLSPAQGGQRLSDLSFGAEGDSSEDAFLASSSQESAEALKLPRVYLTDVKTRGGRGSMPTVKSTSFRPTRLQLQLYYHMLNRLVTSDDVSIELLASRYDLDPHRPFTDAFISEIGGLNDQFFDTVSSLDFDPDWTPSQKSGAGNSSADFFPPGSSQDSTSVLLSHNNLSSLWTLMKDQLQRTFLPPSTSSSSISVAPSIPSEFQPGMLEPYPTVISPLLTARYLSSAPLTDDDSQPRVLGSRSFLFDPTSMTSYLDDQMEWWRGERAPRGVEVMEAWKCRICDFQDDCEWRLERELAFARRNRGKSARAV